MADNHIFTESLSSSKTLALFVTLTTVFLGLFAWRWSVVGWNGWTITFLCITVFFLFYVFNYRTLKIYITSEILQLTFGIVTWKIPVSNIDNCYLDENSLLRYGGAGIHFMFVKGKYWAFFNFLEYPRVVLTLKKKKGPVQEIAFSTKEPDQVIGTLQNSLF